MGSIHYKVRGIMKQSFMEEIRLVPRDKVRGRLSAAYVCWTHEPPITPHSDRIYARYLEDACTDVPSFWGLCWSRAGTGPSAVQSLLASHGSETLAISMLPTKEKLPPPLCCDQLA
jgi:hypothetical protein